MRGAVIKCPQCGAVVNKTGDVVSCDYCGAQVRVQRRTGFFERVEVPLHLPRELLKLPVVIQAHTRRWILFVLVVPFAMLALVIGLVSFQQVQKVTSQRTTKFPGQRSASPGKAPNESPRWDGPLAVATDVNGDGALDVLGRWSFPSGEAPVRLGVLAADSGKRLWLGEPLGTRSQMSRTAMGISGPIAAVASDSGEVFAVTLATGKTAWKVKLAERVEHFCAGGDAGIIAELADETRQLLAVSDGTASPASEGGCEPLEHDLPGKTRPSLVILGSRDAGDSAPDSKRFDGMRVGDALRIGSVRLALGNKNPGTATPMIARYEVPEIAETVDVGALERAYRKASGKERTKLRNELAAVQSVYNKRDVSVLWQVLVPQQPLEASTWTPDPEHIAVAGQTVGVVYQLAGGGHRYRLAGFGVADGRRLWDIEVPDDMPISGISATGDVLLLSTWTFLFAIEPATGHMRWKVK